MNDIAKKVFVFVLVHASRVSHSPLILNLLRSSYLQVLYVHDNPVKGGCFLRIPFIPARNMHYNNCDTCNRSQGVNVYTSIHSLSLLSLWEMDVWLCTLYMLSKSCSHLSATFSTENTFTFSMAASAIL